MRVQTNIEFTEMKKNKKESLKFTLKDDGSNGIGKQLYDMAGNIVNLQIKGCEVGSFPAEFVDIKKSAKGVVVNFLLKGDLNDEQSGQIYAHSGGGFVELTVEESQMSIDEFHDGVEYSVNPDGTVDTEKDENQMDMDEVAASIEETIVNEPQDDISKAKAKRDAQKAKKDAEKAKAAADTASSPAEDPDDALLEMLDEE